MGQRADMSEGTGDRHVFILSPRLYQACQMPSRTLHTRGRRAYSPDGDNSINTKARPRYEDPIFSSRYSVKLLSLSKPCLTLPLEGPPATPPVA